LESIGFEWENDAGSSDKQMPEDPENEEREVVESSEIGRHDVFAGSADPATGNRRFREVCWDRRDEHRRARRREKSRAMAKSVANAVRDLGGRFLEPFVAGDGRRRFRRLSDRRVTKMVQKALRDQRRPGTRRPREVRETGDDNDNATSQSGLVTPQNKVQRLYLSMPVPSQGKEEGSTPEQRARDKESALSVLRNGGIQIGTRLEFFWPLDDRYYTGTVVAQRGSNPTQVSFMYDAEETEWVDLNDRDFKLLEDW
jgi:hypothetical protein